MKPESAAFTAFWMDSPGQTTELCGPAEPNLVTARATPPATNRVRAMVVNNAMVRLISRAAFLQWGGVRCLVQLHERFWAISCSVAYALAERRCRGLPSMLVKLLYSLPRRSPDRALGTG